MAVRNFADPFGSKAKAALAFKVTTKIKAIAFITGLSPVVFWKDYTLWKIGAPITTNSDTRGFALR